MTLILVKPNAFIDAPDVSLYMDAQKEFFKVFEVKGSPDLYATLVEEEHEEWIEDYYSLDAFDFEELKELADLMYVTAGLSVTLGYDIKKASKYTLAETYDIAITDLVSEVASGDRSQKVLSNLMYCIIGYAHEMEWNLAEAYQRVHHSNLSKLDDSGKPVRRADGKVLKGPNYKPPYLEDLTDGK